VLTRRPQYHLNAQIRQGADRVGAPTRRLRRNGPGLAICTGLVRQAQMTN
jgi:hypothetical protein